MNGRQYVPHGPRIPQEVLDALDEERLVFFCGAGISIATFTPVPIPDGERPLNFQGLTTFAFDACNAGTDASGRPTDPAARDAFKREFYDKALEILEASENRSGIMRRNIMRRLTEPPLEDSLTLHRALLALARLPAKPSAEDRGYRLVTTNFDDRFELAGLPERWIEAAPRLSPPHHEVESPVVYVHGRIAPEIDPSGRHLVLTSADFGNAYLRYGWATDYALELFREFTVLFIGYGLNDPVMRYLMDALATESGEGRQFRKAYALASYNGGIPGDKELQEALWRAKNVEPILFAADHDRARPYSLQTETLVRWSDRHEAGLGGRLQDAIEATRRPFVAGQDDREPFDSLSNIVWALSERSGETARRFATFSEPPHASWFGPIIDKMMPVGGDARAADLSLPAGNPVIARWLARWACRHLEAKELINWAVGRHGRLFPALSQALGEVLDDGEHSPVEVCERFWRAVIHVNSPGAEPYPERSTRIAANADGCLTQVSRQNLLRALRPRLKGPVVRFTPAPTPTEPRTAESIRELGEFDLILGQGYTAEIVLRNLERLLRPASAMPDRLLADIADDLTTLLVNALDLAVSADLPLANGRSIIYTGALAAMDRDKVSRHASVQLLTLLLDAWNAATRIDPAVAEMVSRRWLVIGQARGFSLFVRLYIFAVAELDTIDPGATLKILQNSELLWDSEYEPEVLRFLRCRGAALPREQLEKLVAMIERGPAPELQLTDG